ncbi:MAG: nuclear transport factor 2 family protein [Candidatus Omnitrophica bacterium]|nr:nuclear transport factor 2 family protein [Candidatus Omnitrophota bacterium]
MSEPKNVQIVQQIYAAFGRGDIPSVLAALSDDIEWQVTGPAEVAYAGARRGRPQVLEFFTALGQTVDVERFEPQQFIAQEDTVVVLGVERLKIKATGRAAENSWVMVFTLREGRVVRFREYDDTASVAAAFRR